MKDDIRQYVKIGIVHHAAFPLAGSKPGGILESIMDIARDPFFDAIELASIPDSAVRTEVKQLLLSSGMLVCYHAMPKGQAKQINLGSLIEYERLEAIQWIKEAVDEAYEMHAEMFTISDEFISGAFFRKQTLQALEKSLKEICRYTAIKGAMKVAYGPPLSFSETEPSKETIGKISGLGVFIDVDQLPGHYEMNDRNMKHVKKQLIYSRMGNCCKDGRYHALMSAKSQAVNTEQLVHFLRNLCKVDYIGEGKQKVLTFNVKPMENESPHAVIANGKRTLLEAWRLLQRHPAIWPEC
ncbi:hypothetical protein O9H85_27560 [Paenibacillus filicis]|uniref:Xylose isomerase-like TIM barrel domain-containing protein n=1 Tax=Paenibacillus gyeongsangnamensis TaxID=3388067 RepID=A0ABT4QGS7_9BACL|nr:hypothetical protein [Paenibacillus filicis]MCZ8516093.1 hypothetical protein [Paenibacillus filicis]